MLTLEAATAAGAVSTEEKHLRWRQAFCVFNFYRKGADIDEKASKKDSFVCFIKSIELRYIAVVRKLGTGEDIKANVDFAFLHSPDNVQKDRNVDISAYALFSAEDTRIVAKMLKM